MKRYKNSLAIFLFVAGIVYYLFPSLARIGLYNPSFVGASNSEVGLMATIWIFAGLILYFIPTDK